MDRVISGYMGKDYYSKNVNEVERKESGLLNITNASAKSFNNDVLVKLNYEMSSVSSQENTYSYSPNHTSVNKSTDIEKDSGIIRMLILNNQNSNPVDMLNSTYSLSGNVANDFSTFTHSNVSGNDITSTEVMNVNNASFALKNNVGTFDTNLSTKDNQYGVKEKFDFANNVTSSGLPSISGGHDAYASSIEVTKNGNAQSISDMSIGHAVVTNSAAIIDTTIGIKNGAAISEVINGGVIIPRQ